MKIKYFFYLIKVCARSVDTGFPRNDDFGEILIFRGEKSLSEGGKRWRKHY